MKINIHIEDEEGGILGSATTGSFEIAAMKLDQLERALADKADFIAESLSEEKI